MIPRLMILLLCFLHAETAAARRRATGQAIIPPGAKILFIGAHPDDEVVAAPLLGTFCVDGGFACSFLVLTRGERGHCSLPACSPDLGTVREREMQASAALFRASLTQWNLPDAFESVASEWASHAGGRDALMARIQAAVKDSRADVVITFEPAHGTTCHPAHRETGSLVVEALRGIGADAPQLFLIETVATLDATGFRFAAGAAPAIVFDAAPYWAYLIEAASIHQSQFTPQQIDALRATPLAERKVWLARSGGTHQTITCP